jgi:hypothetical protein
MAKLEPEVKDEDSGEAGPGFFAVFTAPEWKHVPLSDRIVGFLVGLVLWPFAIPLWLAERIGLKEYEHPYLACLFMGSIFGAIALALGLILGSGELLELAWIIPICVWLIPGTIVWLMNQNYWPEPGSEPDGFWQVLIAAVLRGSNDSGQ